MRFDRRLIQTSPYLPYVLLALCFAGLATPLIFKSDIDTFDSLDERLYHYPTVVGFAVEFPRIDLIDYPSATTPLYHAVLTLAALVTGAGMIPLRVLNAVISLCALLVCYRYLGRRGDPIRAFYFVLVLMVSPYFLGPAIRLSTDNAALLFALLALYTMDVYPPARKSLWGAGALIACAVLTRQIYAWLIGAYLLFGLLRYRQGQREASVADIVLPSLLPIAGLGYFLLLWGGMAPPGFSAAHTASGLNGEVPVYVLSLLGLYGGLCGMWVWEAARQTRVGFLPVVVVAAIACAVLLVHPVSNEYPLADVSHGDRGGALWLIVSKLPMFLSSSVVFWGLLPVGAVCLYGMARFLIARGEHLMVVSFPLWLAANACNSMTYQKYYEPFLLFLIAYVVLPVKTDRRARDGIGPGLLLLGFLGN